MHGLIIWVTKRNGKLRKYFNYDINMENLFVFGICIRRM